MGEGDDVSRLRAILGVMVDGGLTRLVLADGTTLERPAPSPFEAAARAVAEAGRPDDHDDDEDDEEKRDRALEEAWSDYWTRATRSSGGMVPPYPGADTAMRFFGSRPG